jgi:hypothetical protein
MLVADLVVVRAASRMGVPSPSERPKGWVYSFVSFLSGMCPEMDSCLLPRKTARKNLGQGTPELRDLPLED